MSSEANMWADHVRPLLKKLNLDPVRIENRVGTGFPDVNYIEGWVELKHADAWPKRTGTPLRLDHFTPQQRSWLMRRWWSGGNVWLLLRVAGEWMLFDGATAASRVGRVPRQELYDLAAVRSGGFDHDVVRWLIEDLHEVEGKWLDVLRSAEYITRLRGQAD